MDSKKIIIGGIAVFVILSVVCVIAVAIGIFAINVQQISEATEEIVFHSETKTETPPTGEPTEEIVDPTKEQIPSDIPQASTEEPTPTEIPHSVLHAAEETLLTIKNELVPINDVAELGERLAGLESIPDSVPAPDQPFEVGEEMEFWITSSDTNRSSQVNAVLRYVTPHLYFWIEESVVYDARDLFVLAETFEENIYPTNREFFGSEWSPGVDNDVHLYILYTGGIGWTTAGYFSSYDELHPMAHEYSNAHEMFIMNADNTFLYEEYAYSVLAHEFQHMIHWYLDRNETSWLNEGFSELAVQLNGYYTGGFDYMYLSSPDLQLNTWSDDSSHYGASFLFVSYLMDRLGETITRSLAAHPDNGMDSIDKVLMDEGILGPQTGTQLRADDLVLDWAITNYLNNGSVGDGRYQYVSNDLVMEADITEDVFSCDDQNEFRTVHQYGVDYIRLKCSQSVVLSFTGALDTKVLPMDPHQGDYYFWSNATDMSDMTLTQRFDLTDLSGSITLSYWTWYDLEEDYDYVYLLASENGEDWDIIRTDSSTDEDPSGNSYGWAYNGASAGWKQEVVVLDQYAGKDIYLRFEYVTDTAVHGEGFLLDDIQIPEIGYTSGFESSQGGWEAVGFVRIQNLLPQTFRIALIGSNGEPFVQILELDENNQLQLDLDFSGDLHEAVLVVLGTTRYTRQQAAYWFSFVEIK